MSAFVLNPYRFQSDISFRAFSESSGSPTITIPAGAQNKDVAVLIDAASSATPPTNVTPSGWTQLFTYTSSALEDFRVSVSYKILAGADAGTSVTGMNAVRELKQIYVFQNSNANITNVSDELDLETNASSAALASQTINASGAETPIVAFGIKTNFGANSSTDVTLNGMANSEVTGPHNTYLMKSGYTIYNTNPQNITVSTVDDGNLQNLITFYIRIT